VRATTDGDEHHDDREVRDGGDPHGDAAIVHHVIVARHLIGRPIGSSTRHTF
jgi:hypothetical protein